MVNKCIMENNPRLTSHTTEEQQLSCFGGVKLRILKEERSQLSVCKDQITDVLEKIIIRIRKNMTR